MILEFYPIFASVVYKKNFLGGKKFPSFLHISKKSSTFAADIGLRTLQFYTTMKKILSLFTLILLVQWTFAVDPSTNLQEYYASADGKSGEAIRSALSSKINEHTTVSYDNLKYLFKWTDTYNNAGEVIDDIYSACDPAYVESWCSGDCGYNREHSLPKSWFNEASVLYSDAFHMYPTNCYVNSFRGNLAFGECEGGEKCTTHGVNGKGRKGTSTFEYEGRNYASVGIVYEPDDEFKGDLARSYFYMVTCYINQKFTYADGGQDMFTYENNTAQLSQYSIDLLLKWHRQDPVSQRELVRSEVIYGNTIYNKCNYRQGNRNPFIDYPCLAEYIWGEHKGETVNLSTLVSGYDAVGTDCCGSTTEPTITSPTGTVNFGTTNTSNSIYKDVTVQGTNLEIGSLTLTIGGTNGSYFKLPGGASSTTITKAQAEAGYNITITYTPTANGSHTATLTISGCGVTSHVVELTGTCTTVYTATWMADGSQVGTSYAASGTRPDVPASNPTNCSASRVFVGWTATSGYSGNSAPGDLFTTTAPTITTDKTFYAVYADKSTSAGGGTGSETLTCSAGTIDNNTMRFNTTNFSVEHAKGISANFASYSPWRIYNGNTVTISGSFSITSVVITCGSNDYAKVASNAKLTPTGGGTVSASASSTTCTIAATGTVTSLVISPSAQTRWSEIKINYSGGGSITYSNYSTQCTASSCTLSNITLNTSIVQKSFAVGDAFNYTGLIVTANYSDCESKTVTPTSVSSPDMSTTGDKTVTVSYTESGTTKTATYTITVEAAPEYTVTFMNMDGPHATRTGTAGSAISEVSDPTACTGYTFEGWSTSQYVVDNTVTPSLSTPTTIPVGGATYYAVYSKTEGSGSSAATAGTTLWSEDFSGYSANNVPSGTIASSHTGTTIYGNSTITYACDNGGGTTKIYAAKLAGGTSPEILIAKSNGSFSISGIPTGSAKTMTLLFNTNKSGSPSNFSITSGTSGISIGSLSSPAANQLSCSITNANGVTTFDLTITYTSSQNSREDNFLLTVASAGSGSSTTYHTTAPDCSCTATITATSNDDSMGTVSVATP